MSGALSGIEAVARATGPGSLFGVHMELEAVVTVGPLPVDDPYWRPLYGDGLLEPATELRKQVLIGEAKLSLVGWSEETVRPWSPLVRVHGREHAIGKRALTVRYAVTAAG